MAQLVALFHNVYKREADPPYAPMDFLPGGDRPARLAQSMAVMAEYAANRAAAKRPD